MTIEIGTNLMRVTLWVAFWAIVAYVVNRWWAYSALRNRKP